MTPVRQHAAIRIHPRCWLYSEKKFEKLIIHELLHPLFDPIVKEGQRIDPSIRRVGSHTKYLEHEVERTLDHIANVMYDLNN